MTEREWLECTDPAPMLEFLSERVTERKQRLFGVACCKRCLHLLSDERSRIAVEVAERYADGKASEAELQYAALASSEAAGLGGYAGDDSWGRNSFAAGTGSPARAAAWAATWRHAGSIELSNAAATASVPTWGQRKQEFSVQANLLRCIFGSLLFHPVTINPAWLTWNDGTVRRIAQSIYDERAFERMPILADALTDAGCDITDILNHCRNNGPHVRGCWVVDAVLGKK
jgi:hypothetical protein